MSQRYTRVDVLQALTRARKAAESVGIPGTHRWVIDQGSPTYGRAWRLYRRGDEAGNGSGMHNPFPGFDSYIGWSAREAYDTLQTLARAWEIVADLHPSR